MDQIIPLALQLDKQNCSRNLWRHWGLCCVIIFSLGVGCQKKTKPPEVTKQSSQILPSNSEPLVTNSAKPDVNVWAEVNVTGESAIKKFSPDENVSVVLLIKNRSDKTLTIECKQLDGHFLPLYYVKTPKSDDQIMEWKDGFSERKSDERWLNLFLPLGRKVWSEGQKQERQLLPNEEWEVTVELGKMIDMSLKGEYWFGFLFPMHDQNGKYASEELSGVVIQIDE